MNTNLNEAASCLDNGVHSVCALAPSAAPEAPETAVHYRDSNEDPSIDERVERAACIQRSGDLEEAKRIYHAILSEEPGHPEANLNLGVLAIQQGRPAESIPFFRIAAQCAPAREALWAVYIDALLMVDDSSGAQAVLSEARQHGHALSHMALQPNSTAAPLSADADLLANEFLSTLASLHEERKRVATSAPETPQRLSQTLAGFGFRWDTFAEYLAARDGVDVALSAMRLALALAPEDESLFAALAELARLQKGRASNAIALQPSYDQFVLFCPNVVTGGPEALHQLAHTINTQGGNASIAYYGGQSGLAYDGRVLRATYAPDPAVQEAYAMYEPLPVQEVTLSPRTLLIFPEVLVEQARQMMSAKRAIWWLSVDNAIAANPRLADARYASELLSDPSIIHLYQSDYARRFVERHGARQVLPLFDFINRDYLKSGATEPPRARQIVGLFPRKGADLAARFVNLNNRLPFALIQDMSRDQVRSTLSQCAIYIDFGHHPGKDRVPREAAISGAVIFLHDRGAARHYADHPLDRFYLFSDDDIETGLLHTKIQDVLAHHAEHFANQRIYRQRVVLEMDEFVLQVKTAFFEPCSRN
ncbi:tetratricopeptide repeat protein [Paraburkholderia sp. A1RO-5L]|uniref:tetratricopeptide repeat protein n=1 Tax=unclassified Paraburkholderia TaxID=2615204 RepID=UPI003B7BB1B0